MSEFQYPVMRCGDDVEWAAEPTASPSQWRYGKVNAAKTLSCDIVLYSPTGIEVRADCWHKDDPRCGTDPTSYRGPGRGVFRLAQCEIERRDFKRRMPAIESDIRDIRRERELGPSGTALENSNRPARAGR